MESSLVDDQGKRESYSDKVVESVCPYCGVGCQTEVHVKDDKILYVDGKNRANLEVNVRSPTLGSRTIPRPKTSSETRHSVAR